jgi:hypothetical protein
MASMIERRHHLILDRPDPLALATFYSELFGPGAGHGRPADPFAEPSGGKQECRRHRREAPGTAGT